MPEANAGSVRPPAYEPDTIDASRVLVLAGIVLAVVIGSALGIAWLSHGLEQWYGRTPPGSQTRPLPSTGAGARAAPEIDLDTYRASKRGTLSTYRWVDREHGVVQLPIDQAMRLIAERNAGSEASQ